jgi:hypothetical protein
MAKARKPRSGVETVGLDRAIAVGLGPRCECRRGRERGQITSVKYSL